MPNAPSNRVNYTSHQTQKTHSQSTAILFPRPRPRPRPPSTAFSLLNKSLSIYDPCIEIDMCP